MTAVNYDYAHKSSILKKSIYYKQSLDFSSYMRPVFGGTQSTLKRRQTIQKISSPKQTIYTS